MFTSILYVKQGVKFCTNHPQRASINALWSSLRLIFKTRAPLIYFPCWRELVIT